MTAPLPVPGESTAHKSDSENKLKRAEDEVSIDLLNNYTG